MLVLSNCCLLAFNRYCLKDVTLDSSVKWHYINILHMNRTVVAVSPVWSDTVCSTELLVSKSLKPGRVLCSLAFNHYAIVFFWQCVCDMTGEKRNHEDTMLHVVIQHKGKRQRGCSLTVTVSKHNAGVLPSQLQGHSLQITFGCSFLDQLAHLHTWQ